MDDKIRKFMYGRYGPDELYRFQLLLYFITLLVGIFVRSKILSVIQLLLIASILFRPMSKKIYKRSNENVRFLKIKDKMTKPFTNIKRNFNDKDHIYKKCHKCKTTLKLPLPSKRGIKHAKCPHCGNRVTLLTLKKQKIEIITNNSKKRVFGNR